MARTKTEKKTVTNVSATGIFYRVSNPAELFMEFKDDGHPLAHARRRLCVIGGNWIGPNAAADLLPINTFKRELNEELTFERPKRDSLELHLLGLAEYRVCNPTPQPTIEVHPDHELILQDLKAYFRETCLPWGAYINSVTKTALDDADPANERDGFEVLSLYYAVPCIEDIWRQLILLQGLYGNLSNEALTRIISLDEIIRYGIRFAFGHDRPVQRFFNAFGIREAGGMPLVPHIGSEPVEMPGSYEEILARFDVIKKP